VASWCWRWDTTRRDEKNHNNVQCVIVGSSYLGFSFLYPCHNLLCTTATTIIICLFFGPTRSSRDLHWKFKTFVLFFVFSTVSETVADARTRASLIIGACYNIHSQTSSTTVVFYRYFFIIIIITTRTRDRKIFADSNCDRRREAFMTTSANIFQCALLYSRLPSSTTTLYFILNARCSRELLCTLFPNGFFPHHHPCFLATRAHTALACTRARWRAYFTHNTITE